LRYRPEIDGLRFVCILLVIIYHIRINLFGINIFKGGFIGVDVFFVISGYLITKFISAKFKITVLVFLIFSIEELEESYPY